MSYYRQLKNCCLNIESISIYPDEIESFEDDIKYSTRLKTLMKQHVQNILNSGFSVVMDFPGNTEKQRTWFKEVYAEYSFSHKLIYLEASDNLCIKQIETRRKTNPEQMLLADGDAINWLCHR